MAAQILFLASPSPLLAARTSNRRAEALTVPPKVKREFRAAWVATVANIDWPSQKGLPVSIQKQQLLSIVAKAAALKLNTLIFQVRPACDAVYDSSIEPWSEFISGTQGKAPEPKYDPLAYLVHAAHLRGIQVQAWFNPFRARFALSKSPLAANQVIRLHPSWIVHYGDQTWLNPALPQVQRYVISVIMDVVKRYNVDGVHLDDYFYPYPEKNQSGNYITFNDKVAFDSYRLHDGTLPIASWRRHNIDHFVHTLYDTIKSVKPWVLFGISPFGIWQPSHPPTIKGYNSYAMIYSDSRLWLRNGWCDYLAPQLYWKIEPPAQSFPVLLEWWEKQNYDHRHIWPGIYVDRVDKSYGSGTWPSQEITKEIQITRAVPDCNGAVMFSMVTLMHNAGAIDNALASVYMHTALVPASPWLDNSKPSRPTCVLRSSPTTNGKVYKLSWSSKPTDASVRWWLVQILNIDGWHSFVMPAERRSTKLPSSTLEASIRAVSPSGIESDCSLVNLRIHDSPSLQGQTHHRPNVSDKSVRTGAIK